MKPIEKNVIVVDEKGNEYEATYPKRAKGLVKNGRARFIDENKICLACPPENITEDGIMSNNKEIKVENTEKEKKEIMSGKAELTPMEIFGKIAELQEQLMKNSYHSLHRLDDTVTSICSAEENSDKDSQITEVCSVFRMREETLNNMLSFYRKMYDDLNFENTQKVELIKNVFTTHTEVIGESELKPEDRYALLADVGEKIAELTEKVLFPPSRDTIKEKVALEMGRVIRSKDLNSESAKYASQVLSTLMIDN